VVLWLDVARLMTAFDKTDKFGHVLFLKLAMVSALLLCTVFQTACFVTCHTGNLDQVFLDARLPKSDHIRYRRLAVIYATVCWVLMAGEMLIYAVELFLPEDDWNFSMTPFGNHIAVSGEPVLLIKLFSSLLYFFAYPAWIFPQSVNYIDYWEGLTVCSLLNA